MPPPSLRRYAVAMRTLSEVHWCRADRPQRESTAWCETTLHEYFGGVASDDGQATPAVAGDGGCEAGCGQSTAETGGAATASGLAAALAKDLRRSTYAAGKPTTAPPMPGGDASAGTHSLPCSVIRVWEEISGASACLLRPRS